jgi:hypothetical protein
MAKQDPKTGTKTGPARTMRSPKSGAVVPTGAHPGNTGGKPGRSGRRPFAITLAAQTIVDQFRLLEVAKDIAVGDIWEEWTNKEGGRISSPTKNSDRLAAIKFLVERGYGSAPQHVTLANDAERPVTSPLDDLTRQLARLAPRG